jgi:hypothetical protein
VRGRVPAALATVLIEGLAVFGCNAQPSSGRVTGGIRLASGPYAPHTFRLDHQAGTIIVRHDGRMVRRSAVTAGHAFGFTLPLGGYSLTAQVGMYACPTYTVRVTSEQPASMEVICSARLPIA